MSSNSLLYATPRILYNRHLNLAVIICPKVCCTFMSKWFFFQSGLVSFERNKDMASVHNYRNKTYYQSDDYAQYLNTLLSGKYNVIKVTRNPFDRAVSSYFVTHYQNKTFEEFAEFLQRISVQHVKDGHYKTQTHQLERNKVIIPNFVFDMKDCNENIRKIEKELGLKTSNIKIMQKITHHSNKTLDTKYCGNLKGIAKRNHSKYTYFYNEQTEKIIADVYREDFERYGYSIRLDQQ